jgi:uncharacterized protein (TIGR02597 family)
MNSSALNSLRLAAAVALASVGGSFAQTTATTDPVGFITLNIAGTGGASSNKLSFTGLGMTRPVEYQGSAEAIGTNTVTDNEATWTHNQFNGANGAYYLEIASGPGAGTTYDITGTSAANKRITLAQNLAAGVAAPVSFKVRKHWTIATVFGENNEVGLAGGDEASVSDQILLHVAGTFKAYYYQVAPAGAGGTGWRGASDAFANASGTVIYPDDAVIIRRIQSSNIPVTLLGSVKIGQTSIPVSAGVNFFGNVAAAPFTLGSSQLYTGNSSTGLVGGDEPSTSDQVLLWNGSGYTTYYYQVAPASAGGTGWRNPSNVFADVSGTQVPVGSGFVVKRSNGAAFDWKLPQHPPSL